MREVDQHRTIVGKRRKETERAVRWARGAYDRCATTADKATVLDVLMGRIDEIRKEYP